MRWVWVLVWIACLASAGDEVEQRVIRVRDAATGKPAAGLRLVVSIGGGEQVMRTDQLGRIRVGSHARVALRTRDKSWGLVECKSHYLAYRTIEFSGRVVLANGKAFAPNPSYKVTYSFAHDPARERNIGTAARRLERMGLPLFGELPGPDKQGRIQARLPAVRGLVVRVDGPQWFASAQPIPLDSDTAVEFKLRHTLFVSGVVVDQGKKPVADAVVDAYLSIEGPRKYLTINRAHDRAHGLRGKLYESNDDWARVQIHVRTGTDADGRYRLELPTDGELRVVVSKPGYQPDERPARWLSEPVKNVRFELQQARNAPPLQIRTERKPIWGLRTVVVERFYENGQRSSFELKADKQQRVPTEWFRRGGRYKIRAADSGTVFFVWDGQKAVKLKPGFGRPPKEFLKPLEPPGG